MQELVAELNLRSGAHRPRVRPTRSRARRARRVSWPARSARRIEPPRSRPTSTTRACATSRSMSWWQPISEASRELIEGRRGSDPDRDHFRHAQREGGIGGRERSDREHRAKTYRSSSRGRLPTLRAARCPVRRPRRSGTRSATREPLAVGLNCALGAQQLRPYVEELATSGRRAMCARTPTRDCPTHSASTKRRRRKRRQSCENSRPAAS